MSTKFSNRPVYEQSTEEHQAAGRMGGKARGSQRQQDDDGDNMQPSKRSRSNSSQGNNGKMSRSEAGRKGGLTRAKNQGQGQYQQRGNDFDPEADKYGYDEGDYEDDAIAAHTRLHDQDNDSNDNYYTEPNDEPEGRSSGNRRSSKAHSDFEQGKNPNRQAVSRRVARERGHDAFVEMGRKGGHGNAGIHADMDFDDMDSFREHPELGVPAKNPNRVRGGKQAAEKRGHDELSEMGRMGGEMNAGRAKFGGASDMGEDDSERFNMRDVKDPNRVSGGIRAANKQSHESFVERGKMGAEARWGNSRQSEGRGNQGNNDGQNDEEDDDEQTYDGKNMNRVRGGQKAAQTRAEHGTQYRGGSRPSNQQGRGGHSQGNDEEDDNDDSGMNDDDDSQGGRGKSTSRQQAGKKAAETRARNGTQYRGGSRPSGGNNRQSQVRNNQGNDDEDMDDDNEDDNGKDSTRVQAGKKAAETRASNGTQYRSGSRPSGGNSGNSGGNSRSGSGNGRGVHTNQGKSFEIEEDDDNYDDMNQDHFEDDQGKNPNRVRGGQKAASHFTHEELSERARRAAQTRAQNGTQSRNGSGISRNRQSQGRNHDDDMDYE